MDYLRLAGVNEDVMMIIEHIAQENEQASYLKWLEDNKKFNENWFCIYKQKSSIRSIENLIHTGDHTEALSWNG